MHNWLDHVVKTEDGSLSLNHPAHNQWFHSDSGAHTESTYLYVKASGIEEKFSQMNIRVADIGLGLGYNVLATVAAWFENSYSKDLHITSFEHDEDLWKTISSGKNKLTQDYPDFWWSLCQNKSLTHANGSKCNWHVVIGNIHDFDFQKANYDFVWHDPFSQDVNPTLWTEEYFEKLSKALKRDSVLMTYSVRREVRENLKKCGFEVNKIPTPTRKKNWLKAVML